MRGVFLAHSIISGQPRSIARLLDITNSSCGDNRAMFLFFVPGNYYESRIGNHT